MFSADQIHLLRRSYAPVEARPVIAALIFYRRLFELDPSLRSLFHDDIEAQAAKLMEMLSSCLDVLDRPRQLTRMLEDLGARHAGYGVRAEHYPPVGKALIHMLEEISGSPLAADELAAWKVLLRIVSSSMLVGAGNAAVPTRPRFIPGVETWEG